jgi:tetratricopeptide (TPR) repeat protein
VSELPVPQAQVEAALETLMRWPGLARSPQLAGFLDYIVKAKLRGDEGAIKAYSIAVDVFGRPQSFDPQTDPIVRVQARRLRALLEEYYAGEGAQSPVRFELPVGRYVPEFKCRDEAELLETRPEELEAPRVTRADSAAEPSPSRRRWRARLRRNDAVLLGISLIVGIGIIAALFQVFSPRTARIEVPQPPSIGVSDFRIVASADSPAFSVAGLGVELVTDLALFEDVVPSYMAPSVSPTDPEPQFLLGGIARQDGDDVEITASLRRPRSDTALWSDTLSVPREELQRRIDDVSRIIAGQLGAHRGPLHQAGRQWLDENREIAGNETLYLCALLFSRYRDSALAVDADQARDCLDALLRREVSAPALAMRAGLLLDKTFASRPSGYDPEPLAEADRMLKRAMQLAPTSNWVWLEYARYLEGVGRVGEAESAYLSSLQLNPANFEAKAAYARMLSLRGESDQGIVLASEVVDEAMVPPHWYYAATAVNHLRAKDDPRAIEDAEKLAQGDAELGSVIATVAAFRSSNTEVLNRYFAQMLEGTRYRRFGILPVLRQRLPDPALLAEIVRQLRLAGVSEEALAGPA